MRRHRRRRAVGALAALVLVLGTSTGVAALRPDRSPQPARVPFDQLHLPRTAYPPSPWAAGTDHTGAPGRLAFVSAATRYRTDGLRGHQEVFQPFGVSAEDGSAVFLDLPGTSYEALGSYALTLSPDGAKVGYTQYDQHERVRGFAVYDATTGATTVLRDPERPVIRTGSLTDLAFSGDSRYLETTYARDGAVGNRHASLVVWDVRSGALTVAEPPGRRWWPLLGSGPSGIVWSRGRDTFTYDPTSGDTTSVRAPVDVVEAGYGPDGRAFAMIGEGRTRKADWRLLAGATPAGLREVPLDIDADDLLGWRDAQHVVVRQLPTGEAVEVDITTGRVTSLRLDATGRQMMLPSYAADLWANPLVDGERPPDVHDPRLPAWIAAGAGAVVALGLLLWRRRRVRA